MSHTFPERPTPVEVYEDPVVQLAALCPICALAALSPAAALAALSPGLALFNPAINPRATVLAFFMPRAPVQDHVRRSIGVGALALLLRLAARRT